jgi:hypothetical protein
VLVRAAALIWIIVACLRPTADDATPSLRPVRQLR